MTNEEYFAKLKELSDAYNKPTHTRSACPACGHCPHCGRGGYARPYYVPYTPYVAPYPHPWLPTWTSITCGGTFEPSTTVRQISNEQITWTDAR
jgi:hypothetical protein